MSNTAQSPASRRIEGLLDGNSFVEIGGQVTARSTDFNLQQSKCPSDGVVTGYGLIDGNLVYVYSQPAAAVTEHCRDLRNYAGRQRLLGINLSECVQGVYALLQTDTCAVDQTDDRRSHLTCQLVQTYNLLRMHLTQGSVQYGSVLTVHIDKITVNQTIAGN